MQITGKKIQVYQNITPVISGLVTKGKKCKVHMLLKSRVKWNNLLRVKLVKSIKKLKIKLLLSQFNKK